MLSALPLLQIFYLELRFALSFNRVARTLQVELVSSLLLLLFAAASAVFKLADGRSAAIVFLGVLLVLLQVQELVVEEVLFLLFVVV